MQGKPISIACSLFLFKLQWLQKTKLCFCKLIFLWKEFLTKNKIVSLIKSCFNHSNIDRKTKISNYPFKVPNFFKEIQSQTCPKEWFCFKRTAINLILDMVRQVQTAFGHAHSWFARSFIVFAENIFGYYLTFRRNSMNCFLHVCTNYKVRRFFIIFVKWLSTCYGI